VTLGWKLAIVLVAFVAILTIVIFMAFRERRLGKTIATDDTAAQQASDARVLTVIFSAILGGMLLTVLVAWLVFL
jgi:membrane protein implicated in regulation of membrane protease activity